MSNTQYVFINRDRIPDREELQSSISALGFNVIVDQQFSLFEDSGFIPFVLNGQEGQGFEIDYSDAEEIVDGHELFREIADGRDHCICMTWSSSFAELACVLIVSCALTKDFDAIVSYEGDPPSALEDMLAQIPDVLEHASEEKKAETIRASAPNHSKEKPPWWKFW